MPSDGNDLGSRIDVLESELTEHQTPRAFAPLAEAYRLEGRPDEALRTARQGADLYPQHTGILVVLARALASAGERDEAVATYESVLELDPENLEAAAFLAPPPEPVVTAERAPEEERTQPAEGIESALTFDASAKQAAEPLETGTLSEELAHLADLFVSTSRNGNARDPGGIATLTLAEIYSRQGLYDKAVEVCEQIQEREPDNETVASRLKEYREQLASV